MNKINNQIIHYFFNSLMFITNKSFYINTNEIHSKMTQWIIFNSDISILRFKQLLNYLYYIQQKNKKKKILFIIDENILSFFNDLESYNCYYSSNIKDSFDFLYQQQFLDTVSCIIYIGPEDDFHNLNFNVPFIGFTFQNYSFFDYQVSTYTYFHSGLLFLKTILISLLK